MDLLILLILAGLAIFPLVFANNLTPGDGPGLVFNTLPLAFGNMPGGVFFSSIFFLLLSFAAWTSAIGLWVTLAIRYASRSPSSSPSASPPSWGRPSYFASLPS